MTRQEYKTKKIKEAAMNGYYKIDIKMIDEIWDMAYEEGYERGFEDGKAFNL